MNREVITAIELLKKNNFSKGDIIRNISKETYDFNNGDINHAFDLITKHHYTLVDSDFDMLVEYLYEMNAEKLNKVWIVKLGNLYYVQGLHRYVKGKTENSTNIEVTSHKEAAWIFPAEEVARDLAERSGGEVEMLEISSEELKLLLDANESHTNSEIDWNKHAEEEMFNASLNDFKFSENPLGGKEF